MNKGEKAMNYGNDNALTGAICLLCRDSIAKHGIGRISSSAESEELARKLQALLSRVDTKGLQKGYELPRDATMVGAAIVNYQSSVKKLVTVSGPGVELLAHIDQGKLGKGVVVVDDVNAAKRGKLLNIQGQYFTPTYGEENAQYTYYPLGACAAQKLLATIFQDKQAIREIHMSEIFWRSMTGNEQVSLNSRQWRTGEVVPSCGTCMQVLPQMLCSAYDFAGNV